MKTNRLIGLLLLASVILPGCSTTTPPNHRQAADNDGGGAVSWGGVGYASGLGSAQAMSTTAASGVVMTASTFIVGKYKATELQRQIAEARARKIYAAMPVPRKSALKTHKIRYLAVATKPDARSRGAKSVMIWDTSTEAIVGNNVYDVGSEPKKGVTERFETFAATYVGDGG